MKGFDAVLEYIYYLLRGQTVFLKQAVCLTLAVGYGNPAFLQTVAYICAEGEEQMACRIRMLSGLNRVPSGLDTCMMFLWAICWLMCCEKHEPNSIYVQLPVDIGRGLFIVYFKYKGTKKR